MAYEAEEVYEYEDPLAFEFEQLKTEAGLAVECLLNLLTYYASAPGGGGIKRCFCLTSVCLTSEVCLSHTSGLTLEQRGLGRLKLAQR